MNCDLTTAFEDGGIGGIVVAIIWGLWAWWKRHRPDVSRKGA
jgi:hypothetical protein